MTIESIKSSGISYQAPVSNSAAKPASETPREARENIAVGMTANIRTESNQENVNNDQQADNSGTVDAIKKAVEELNKTSTNNTVQFGVHEKTNRMTIKILDKDTRKVIKEFPAEKSLDLIAKAMEMAGILVDEKR